MNTRMILCTLKKFAKQGSNTSPVGKGIATKYYEIQMAVAVD